MTELLTAKDVEVKAFKKVSFGGYAIPEVEDFLNQLADDLEAYALRLTERENRIHELEEYVKKQESMTDMIKDALIQARKGAKEMEEQARAQTGQILEDARLEAEKRIAEARSKIEEIDSQAGSKITDAERTASELVAEAEARAKELIAEAEARAKELIAEAGVRARELDAQSHAQLEGAERTAMEIVAKAKASSAGILQESKDMRQETERRWSELEQELMTRRQEVAEQIDRDLSVARAEARRLTEDASREVQDYEDRLRVLNLRKQQFLKDTLSLLLEFGKMLDKAQQEFDVEMDRAEKLDRPDVSAATLSSEHIERFRKNFLEGRPEDARASEVAR
ncbi:MAG: DivIVA domain-containing protein [Synergistaceae bacterium]|nr:DivIVA domain-containing protein [Synergistaceae bacterium]